MRGMCVSAAPNIQLPPIDDILDRAHVVALPMAVKFRGVTTREALLIDGPATWGEFAPFLEYEAPEAAAWLRSAIECAYVGLPTPKREFVEVNATIPAITPEQVPEVVGRYPGCRTFKVKVAESGQSLNDDIERVAAVRTAVAEAYGYEPVVRVDANRGWSVEQAIRAAHELGPLEYMEQPVATVAELRQVRDAVGDFCPVAADESIRKAEDPYLVAREQAADVGVMKVAPLGGPRRLLRLAEELAMKVTVASALDTGIGMAAGLFTAAALPTTELQPEPNAAGLATSSLFIEDVIEPRPLIDGRLPVTNPAPDPSRLAELAAPGPRRDWWFDRLRAAYAHL
ncbi:MULTISPECIES: o-succinylbenzoate synthase [Corynebacterium]|uniref:o-succinylbenzoate synthase n=1 Tax=Corynebacterium TaxID=1716 RepID=UPI00124721AB|nr:MULTISPECIES: o-succinylbenzoate synthase [Corynebacterium]KAA9222249.1 O-succinylbenzoate synthase [Corynebacterium amycolatum]MBC6829049.1 O-succinylbenzoate synthase [Corynebacterium sp. LK32]MCT1548620.1 o-succinylbenzoate synthase [Corynebacterium amycolatum]MDK6443751.1 o-succinylbenzoate synthase [Corynebacterium amycolatum]